MTICFLIRMPTRLTLIDTGVSPPDSAFGRWLGVGGTLPDELAALGVAPDDVYDVILTTSTLTTRGGTRRVVERIRVPRFSNARYCLHDAVAWMGLRGSADEGDVREFAEAIAPSSQRGSSTRPSGPRVVAGFEPATRAGSPRTPVRSLGRRGRAVLFIENLLHFTFQLNDPEFRSPGDDDPEEEPHTGRVARSSGVGGADARDRAHVPPSPIGRIVREGGRLLRRR